MNYCCNCNELINGYKCNTCGNKKLREVKGEDFCHFATLNNLQAGMFLPILEDNNIEVATMPQYIFPATFFSAGKSQSKKLYVKYKNIERATELYKKYIEI